MLSQQISKVASAAAGGNLDAFKELKAVRDNIEADINAVRDGSAKDGLDAYKDSGAKDQIDKWSAAWKPVRDAADKIQQRSELVLNITETANDLRPLVSYGTRRRTPPGSFGSDPSPTTTWSSRRSQAFTAPRFLLRSTFSGT